MALELYYHPLSSCCMKALVGLYELGTAFEPVFIDLGDAASRDRLAAVWLPLRFPVLRDAARGRTIAESSVVVEYANTLAGGTLLPREPGAAAEVRMWDRIFDGYIQSPMQKIVSDALRPASARDAHGVEEARRQLAASCAFLESRLGGSWAAGDDFSLADCSAAPALFYADTVQPFGPDQPRLRGYLSRLCARPSFARALAEAEPFFGNFPVDPKPSRQPGS